MIENKRHLRGIWVATVDNLDWPSKPSWALPDLERILTQQQELIDILDKAVALRMNAVFFQVKPTSDAFYRSTILPWSSYLTGTLGQDPGYDPLQFIVEQAHKRNLELHAWFNPYRVSLNTKPSTIKTFKNIPVQSPESVYVTNRDWIGIAHDRFVINPGIPEARSWVIQGVMEVAEKYDVDGIHFDDYFYYETNTSKLNDDSTFTSYGSDFTNKGDWRRNNTLVLITELSQILRLSKPYIKFGVSPSGVWRNKIDDPLGSDTKAGAPHYDYHYADTRLWILQELIDYIAPQVYWSFSKEIARFDIITKWWAGVVQNTNVHLYIGEALYKVGSLAEPEWQSSNGVTEITKQLMSNIETPGIYGSILFRYSCLHNQEALPVTEVIQQKIWPFLALIPPMNCKDNTSPKTPLNLTHNVTPEGIRLQWENDTTFPNNPPTYYTIYRFTNDQSLDIKEKNCLVATVRYTPNQQQTWIDNSKISDHEVIYSITALNRNHIESDCISVTISGVNNTESC